MSHVWAVVPLLTPWRGDLRRNPSPYVYGRSYSLNEFSFLQSVKRQLESRSIACYLEIVSMPPKQEKVESNA